VAAIAPKLGTTFLPQETLLEYRTSITMEEGTSVDQTNELASEVEEILLNNEDIEKVSTSVREGNAAISFVMSEDVKDINGLVADLRSEFKEVDGAKEITLTSTGDMTGGGQSYLQIVVNGPKIKDIEVGSEQMVEALKEIDGLEEVLTTC